ncbi:diaminopimelate epimerase [Buchnera aphidicola]|uniref:diaminopimelate epimerase n=1 Tax=Buchnera aphidicola TaxID=9 RepID=UPI0031B875F8
MYFSKMHGLGNDFVIFDRINQNFHISPDIIKKISHRNLGIGCDQVLFVEKSQKLNFDFYYRIFNADGCEVAQCGNGARCFAYFVYLKNLTKKREIYVYTNYSSLVLNIKNSNNIIVDMGKPQFNFNKHEVCTSNNLIVQNLKINTMLFKFGAVFLGNPHCVIIVKNIKKCNVDTIGKYFNQCGLFKDGVNVNFMQVVSKNNVILRVYERGVGETQACGSGACAAVVFGITNGLLDSQVIVNLPGGKLRILWKGLNHSVYMCGPAVHVYDGFIDQKFLIV